MILVLFLYFLFAVAFVLAKGVVAYVQPIFFVGIRMLVGGLLLIGYQYWRDKSALFLDKRDWFLFFKLSFFHIFITYAGEFWALKYISATKVSLLFNMSPFITAGLCYWLFSELLTNRQLLGLFIGLIGMIPILFSQDVSEQVTTHVGFLSVPEIVLLVAVVAGAYGWILVKFLVTERNYTPIIVNAYAMVLGGAMSFFASFALEPMNHLILPAKSPLWDFSAWSYSIAMIIYYLIILVLVGNIIIYPLYAQLLRRYSATFLSFAGFTIPLFTALLDWLIFGELIGFAFILSMIFVVGGLYLFYQDEQHTIKS